MRFTVVLQPEEEGGFTVTCPAIPGCVSQGEDLEDALESVREAILLCLGLWREEGLPEPEENAEMVIQEIAEVLFEREEEDLPLTIVTHVVEVPDDEVEASSASVKASIEPLFSLEDSPRDLSALKPGARRALLRAMASAMEELAEGEDEDESVAPR